MHRAFKKAHSYKVIGISPNPIALENVLIPEVFIQHQNRLRQAGLRNARGRFAVLFPSLR